MYGRKNWQDALVNADASGVPHVLVTILAITGSAPREGGTKMVVTEERVVDTIGGGQLELLAIERSRAILAGQLPASQQVEHYPLAASALQCCGGSMTLLYEPLGLNRPDIVVFGAGHVGQAVLHLLATLPVTTSVIDSRLDWLESASAQHKLELVEDDLTPSLHQQALMRLVPANAWVLVMTHDHVTDYALIKGLIERTDLNFLGLIGSKTKWKNFSRRLLRDGLSESSLQRVQCPIGAGASRFKQPMAIAVDIVAELLRHLSLHLALALNDGATR